MLLFRSAILTFFFLEREIEIERYIDPPPLIFIAIEEGFQNIMAAKY